MEMADNLGIKDYPCPAGGCLLTDRIISARLMDLFVHTKDYSMTDIRLLRIGRHLRIRPDLKLVVGRNELENDMMENMAGEGAAYFTPEDFRGPSVLASRTTVEAEDRMIGEIIAEYSGDMQDIYSVRRLAHGHEPVVFSVSTKAPREMLDSFQIEPWLAIKDAVMGA
jgi:tRNA-uridine 2-sulfurtransferase